MLKTGAEHLESLRDGRVVYIGSERVADVTAHPAFRNAARTVAGIYDMKLANPEAMSFEEDGERYSIYYLRPRTREDLARRTRGHRMIAELTYGMFGRSPDHVASFVTGMAMKPDELKPPCAFASHLLEFYEHIRKTDAYVVYAVVPPQAARNPEFYSRRNIPVPALSVVREEDDGLVISGMKMLATGAVLADEIWLGNVIPLAPDQKKQAITCSLPVASPGLALWSRKPFERAAASEFDSPLAWRFDETDAMVMCEEVKVPWERVFVHDDALLSRDIYVKTPSHCFGNHQSNVRYWSKMRLLLGLCSKVAHSTGAIEVPAVKEVLGHMSAVEGMIAGMVHGQIEAHETWPEGYVCFNRRMMYAALEWCTQNYSTFVDQLRELCGGGVFQMPADISVVEDDRLARQFETYFQTPQGGAVERMKLFKLAWDLVGSEFAGRHLQYEKFYAGASFIVRNHAYRETPWNEFHGIVEGLMSSYDIPRH
ncbi:MAG TPA: 4-hydroxyphenylacetate 3-hydroxylase N-terminal domain-containing protein [Burkholderiales bacterium]